MSSYNEIIAHFILKKIFKKSKMGKFLKKFKNKNNFKNFQNRGSNVKKFSREINLNLIAKGKV